MLHDAGDILASAAADRLTAVALVVATQDEERDPSCRKQCMCVLFST